MSNYNEAIQNLKSSLCIVLGHSEYLLDTYDRLSDEQVITMLKSIQTQTALLNYLLDELIKQDSPNQ